MKKLLLTTAIVLVSLNANAAILNGTAAVEITGVPITLTQGAQMNFGSLVKPTVSGASYRVGSDGTKTATNIVQTNVSAVSAATFTIDAPSGAVNVTISDVTPASTGMTLSNFDFNYNGTEIASNAGTGLAGGTTIPVSLGAQLNVPTTVAMGITHASYNVEVDYQ